MPLFTSQDFHPIDNGISVTRGTHLAMSTSCSFFSISLNRLSRLNILISKGLSLEAGFEIGAKFEWSDDQRRWTVATLLL